MDPKHYAEAIVATMTPQQKDSVREHASGDWAESIRASKPEWTRHQVADCLDEIDLLCGYENE